MNHPIVELTESCKIMNSELLCSELELKVHCGSKPFHFA
jgi:hypothetical protein